MNFILAFVFLVVLGYAASHLSLFQSRVSLGFRFLFTAGTEFLFVGWILGPTMTGVITEQNVAELTPILSLGLGWIGLLLGLQFSRETLSRIPANAWQLGGIYFVGCLGFLSLFFYVSTPLLFSWVGDLGIMGTQLIERNHILFIGFVLLLGSIGSLTTASALGLLVRDHKARGDRVRLLQLITEIRAPAAITLMGVWYAVMHVSSNPTTIRELASGLLLEDSYVVAMEEVVLSGSAWLLVTLLLGVGMGWLLHYLTSQRLKESEMLLLLAGMVIFSGGLSSFLHLSPLFVNMIMGITLANLPNFSRTRMTNLLLDTEKPFFVIFMLLVGTMWPPISIEVLAFAGLFIAIRTLALLCCGWCHNRMRPIESEQPNSLIGLSMLPMGGLSIALAIDYNLIRPGFFSELAIGIAILVVLVNQIFGPPILASILATSRSVRSGSRTETPISPEGAS